MSLELSKDKPSGTFTYSANCSASSKTDGGTEPQLEIRTNDAAQQLVWGSTVISINATKIQGQGLVPGTRYLARANFTPGKNQRITIFS